MEAGIQAQNILPHLYYLREDPVRLDTQERQQDEDEGAQKLCWAASASRGWRRAPLARFWECGPILCSALDLVFSDLHVLP